MKSLIKFYPAVFFRILLILVIIGPVSCQEPENLSLEAMWLAGQYEEVLPELLIFRDNNPAFRSASFDFMIATSFCSLDDEVLSKRGCDVWFPRVLSYNIDYEQRKSVKSIQNKYCAQANEVNSNQLLAINTLLLRRTGSAGVGGDLKHFHPTDNTISSKPIRVLREIPEDEIKSRIIKKSGVAETDLLSKGFDYVSKNFLFKSYSGHNSEKLASMANHLEPAYSFFIENYGFSEPDHFITIYLVSHDHIRDVADEKYGIALPVGAIGYSNHEDWSMLGLIRKSSIATGTLKHELFHLLVQENFGDIPVWFEEGLASLYEESKFENGKLMGVPGWRGNILRQYFSKRPTIEELVKMKPYQFNNVVVEGEPEFGTDEEWIDPADQKQAVNHAMARYLMIYLQNNYDLQSLYKAFKNTKSSDFKLLPGDEYVKLLEQSLNISIEELDQNFVQWFKSL